MKRIPDPEIRHVWTGDNEITFSLVDGRVLTVPLAWFPRLLAASTASRHDLTINADKTRVHWPLLDEDISVRVLLGLPS